MIKDIVKKLLESKPINAAEKAELLLFFELAEQSANIRNIKDFPTFGGGTLVVEDLTSQITGANTHFELGQVATGIAYVTCNLTQQPTSHIMDGDMRGFYLTFTPTTRDKLIVGYYI